MSEREIALELSQWEDMVYSSFLKGAMSVQEADARLPHNRIDLTRPLEEQSHLRCSWSVNRKAA